MGDDQLLRRKPNRLGPIFRRTKGRFELLRVQELLECRITDLHRDGVVELGGGPYDEPALHPDLVEEVQESVVLHYLMPKPGGPCGALAGR